MTVRVVPTKFHEFEEGFLAIFHECGGMKWKVAERLRVSLPQVIVSLAEIEGRVDEIDMDEPLNRSIP